MKIAELNHVALRVRHLETSVRFYREVIGLALIPRPAFSFPGAWFRLGSVQELHLIEGAGDEPGQEGSRDNHFALRVEDFAAAARELQGNPAVIRGPVIRPDGARQIFLRDPDGHFLELCGDLPASPSS